MKAVSARGRKTMSEAPVGPLTTSNNIGEMTHASRDEVERLDPAIPTHVHQTNDANLTATCQIHEIIERPLGSRLV
jgi:hypothetical protein